MARATAIDTNRNAVAGVPVTISVNSNAIATPSGTITGPDGTLTAIVGIGADSSIRAITVSASSGSLTKTAQLRVQAGASSGLLPTLAIGLSNTSISSATPATVTATLRDANNGPVSGQVIAFKVVRGSRPRGDERGDIVDPCRRHGCGDFVASQFYRRRRRRGHRDGFRGG